MIDALPLLLGPEGYQISRSVRLRSSASAYFNRTMAPAGVTVYTFSAWVKRGELGTIKPIVQGYLNNNNYGHIIFKADNTIEWREVSVAANYGQVNTNAVFRDPSAWYHIVVVRNGTSLLIYVNGVSQTLTVSTGVNAAAGYLFGGSTVQRIGSDQVNSAFFDGYLTECYLIDGQALTPSSFGSTNATTGVWQPIKYTGTYGTNGFYLNFSDNSAATAAAIGADSSGNGNNWTPNNISVTAGVTYDSMLDVPTQWADGGNGRGNYSVMNPLDKNASGTMAEGNLKWTAGAAQVCTRSTFAIPASGKFYMECLVGTASSATVGISFGLAASTVALDTSSGATNLYQLYASTNRQINLNNSTTGSLSGGFSANDILQIAVDVDNQKMWLGVNNTWYNSAFTGNGDPVAGTNATSTASMVGFFPFSNCYQNSAYWNFGQRPFAYTPPTGFKALNTLNLPTPTILKGNQYFNATTYTGNGTGITVTNSGSMQPDFVWAKNRSNVADHALYDALRTAMLSSNTAAAEVAASNVVSYNSNGFTISGGDSRLNANGNTYVAWQWKEGATQGFDIVTYTGNSTAGRTVAHNLGVAPAMIITKTTNTNLGNWGVYHQSLGATRILNLNLTAAAATTATAWNNTAPTSSVFTVGTGNDVNGASNYVAYLFSEVAGFSRFGSYTGNGSADGPFVFCGFRPAFLLIKSTTDVESWVMIDAARNTFNVVSNSLLPNSSSAENLVTAARINTDFLSNGFKLRNAGDANPSITNKSGSTYIFAAFAESPFKNSLAR